MEAFEKFLNTNRKYKATMLCIFLSFIAPIVYQKVGVPETVMLMVIGIFGGVVASYHMANVAIDKIAAGHKAEGGQ
jgi:hypothetical protein